MKKTITAITLLAGAATGFSQGQIQMFDYGSSFAIQVFAKSTIASPISVTYGGYTVLEEQGNTAGNDNPGSATYTGAPLGSGYDVELLAGPSGSTLATLLPVAGSLVTTWETGAGAGYWNTAAIATVPSVTTTANVAIAAWAATGALGAATTLAAAQVDGYAWGISDVAPTAPLGFGTTQPPNLPATLTSFSINTSIPEPSTVALGVIGASSFLMRLRRKK